MRGLLLALVAGAAVYGNTLSNGFAFDDFHVVGQNARLGSDGPGVHIFEAQRTQGGVFYRPLGFASLEWTNAFFGRAPWAYHAGNVLLHLLAVMVVFFFARRLARDGGAADDAAVSNRVATIAALIFAVHPVATEVVASVGYRFDVLAGALAIAALAMALRAVESARPAIPAIVSGALGLAACLTKESAAALPMLVATLVLARPAAWRRVGALVLLHGLVVAGYLALRSQALGGALLHPLPPFFTDVPFVSRVLTMLAVFARYVWLTIYPRDLSVSYSHLEPNRGPDALVIAGALLLLGCCAGAVALRRRHPPAAVGQAIFPLALLPVSHLSPISVLMAERFLYLSLVGAAVAIAWMLGTAPLRPVIRNTLVAVLVLGFAFRAADRNRDWKHPLRLAEATVELMPDNAFAQYFLGNEAFGVGDVDLAVKSFKRALELDPRQTGWRIALAHGFHLLGRHDEELQVLLQGDQGAKTPPDLRERTNLALREQELLKRQNPPR